MDLIKAFKVNHKITCYGYMLEIERQVSFDVAKAEKTIFLRCIGVSFKRVKS